MEGLPRTAPAMQPGCDSLKNPSVVLHGEAAVLFPYASFAPRQLHTRNPSTPALSQCKNNYQPLSHLKAHFPTAPRDCHVNREEGKHTFSLSLYLSTIYLVVPTWAKDESPLRVYFLASVSNTWGVYFPSRKSPIPPNSN